MAEALVQIIQRRVRQAGSRKDAAVLQWFFKTGPGEYGEGDVFAGVRVPVLRRMAREFAVADEEALRELLLSEVHEDRLLSLLILVRQFERGGALERRRVYRFYCRHMARINNWDLVDLSAPGIVGAYLVDRSRQPLYLWCRSPRLWRRRIAVLATFAFIRRGEYADTFELAGRLLGDPEDLMHKATGWMLREIGKRDKAALEGFLARHAGVMPRTMLRYAIERFPEAERRAYLEKPWRRG